MSVSEEARVFQVRGLRCSMEFTVLGLSPVRLGNRTYRAWRTPKLMPMVRFCGVRTQMRSAFLTAPVPTRKPKITRLNT